jgi:hypothetical protein
MAGAYERWLPTLGPSWLRAKDGASLTRSIGKLLDGQTTKLRQALAARTPDGAAALGISTTDEAGRFIGNWLDRQGDDRLLPRGGSSPSTLDESDASYAERLQDAWDTWGQRLATGGGAGSPLGLLTQLGVLGFPLGADGAIIVNHLGRCYTLEDGSLTCGDCMDAVNRQQTDGTVPTPPLKGFTLDARDQFHSRFTIIFGQDVPDLTSTPNDGTAAARLNYTVRNWKTASAIYMGAVVVAAGGVWGWPFTKQWGDGGKWGDSAATTYYISPT